MISKIQKLLIFLFVTRLIILVLPWLTTSLLFPENHALNFVQFIQTSWNRWDAPHYLYLAQNWYTAVGDARNFIVFFPLYPLIIRPLITLGLNPVFAGILISSVLFLAGSYFFYKLVSLDYSEKIAEYAVIAMAIFPTSYFFNTPYTESLFLLLFSLSCYSARKEKWLLSGIFTGLAVLTRPTGILILPAILIEWFISKKRKLVFLGILVLPSLIAVCLYLLINNNILGDPFAFQKILATHWQKHLVSPLSSLADSWRIAFSGGLTNFTILVGWAEAIATTLSFILIPVAFMKLRKSWALFYLLNIIAFSSTGFILSSPRYLLSIPPFFVLIALAEKNYLFKVIWGFISVGLLFCLSILFARGQWAF